MRRIESQRQQWPHRVAALYRHADEPQSESVIYTDSTSSGLAAGTALGVGYGANDTANNLAQSAAGNPYEFGGAGPGSTNVDKGGAAESWDCSGIAGDLYSTFRGQDAGGEFATDASGERFNTTSDFGAMGFERGYQPGAFNVGVNPQAGGAGHMSAELPGGQGVESSGSGGVEYGSGAQDVNSFQQQWHLPGTGEFDASAATAASGAIKDSRRVAESKRPSRQELHKIMDAIEDGGWKGITFRDKPGDGPTSGYMVSPEGMEHSHPIEELSGAEIEKYLNDPRRSRGDAYGGWRENDEDGDLWYHDSPVNIADSYDATRAAVDWKQKAIFDNDKRDAHGNPLDSAYIYTGPLANSGPASALGWTQASRRRRQ